VADLSAIDYDAEYNNRARVADNADIMAGWARDAAAYRSIHPPVTVAYGTGERETIDLFDAGQGGPLVMFIHGGYWQALDGSSSSHLARGLNAHGISVAVPTYDLCPNVSVAKILDQMRAAAMKLHGIAGQRIVAVGHSAGGHLAACLLATDWKSLDPDLPADLVPAAYAISGLFDLKPLASTYLNKALQLDDTEAMRLSPMFWTPPQGKSLHAITGALESSEYHRQSREMAQRWKTGGARTEFELAPGANHFTIVAPLADPDSKMVRDIIRLRGA
jgi:arylformamidase